MLKDVFFGDESVLWVRTSNNLKEWVLNWIQKDMEKHVNRRMNVLGSGGAHAGYFRKEQEKKILSESLP